jgi:hypothetical protein
VDDRPVSAARRVLPGLLSSTWLSSKLAGIRKRHSRQMC